MKQVSVKTKKSLVGHRDEIEAMTIICNIQMMQEKIHGKSFYHWQFNGNTIEELRNLQDEMIKEYNATFTK
jgi:hypothetical protein